MQCFEAMSESDLLLKVEHHIKEQFKNSRSENLYYHNLEHTEIVVEKVKLALNSKGTTEVEYNNIVIAAWFHDLGYLYEYDNHEEKSISLCEKFLSKEGVTEDRTHEICNMIKSTKFTILPNNKNAALLKDIDIAYALYTDFKTKGDLLKQEIEVKLNKQINNNEWNDSQIKFLKEICFYSSYGKENYNELLEETKRSACQ